MLHTRYRAVSYTRRFMAHRVARDCHASPWSATMMAQLPARQRVTAAQVPKYPPFRVIIVHQDIELREDWTVAAVSPRQGLLLVQYFRV